LYTYPLRAESADGTELVPFTLDDGPCKISEEFFVLTTRIQSPILKYETILRGSDITGLFEGDYVEIDGVEYLVVTKRYGLCAVGKEGDLKDFIDVRNFNVVSNIYKRKEHDKLKRKVHRYKYSGIQFNLDRVYGMHKGKLLLNHNGGMLIPIKEIQQETGNKIANKVTYYGDDGLFSLRGHCVKEVGDKLFDCMRGEFIDEMRIRHWR
jgi:hypothetical protein